VPERPCRAGERTSTASVWAGTVNRMTEEEFFAGHPEAKSIHEKVVEAVRAAGPADVRVSKSQVGFSRARPFAATWRPGRHLTGEVAPLVLTVFLRHRHASPRWKQIVEPQPGRFTHHLELRSPEDVDAEVRGWLQEAWREAA
jgi:Domain of unknown function (DUF5655)